MERKKPTFWRKDWHKKLRLGKKQKKLRKWRASKGRHAKVRMKQKGYARRPNIGWAKGSEKGKINGINVKRIENLKQLEELNKGETIVIAKLGRKKREEIMKKANEKELKIINRYKQNKESIK